MRVLIADFAAERNVDQGAVSKYIQRHPEIKRDVSSNGYQNEIATESEGYAALCKMYPLPKPVEIIEDTESRRQLIKAQELIIQLQKTLQDQTELIAQHTLVQMRLEDKEKELAAQAERLSFLEKSTYELSEKYDAEKSARFKDRAAAQQQHEADLRQLEEAKAEIAAARAELDQERAKTWFQKLLGR